MVWRMHSCTHPGWVRNHNEDVVCVDEALGAVVVADGVGGHQGGERAAQASAEVLLQTLQQAGPGSGGLEALIRQGFRRAHQAVLEMKGDDRKLRGMSTTLTCARLEGHRAVVGHVGDSRAYHVSERHVEQVTRDHLHPVARVGPGPYRGRALARAIGIGADAPEPDIRWVEVSGDDGLILCSDGLSDLLRVEDELADVWRTFGPDLAPDALVDLSLSRGAPDNVAVAVVSRLRSTDGQADRLRKARSVKRAPLLSELSDLALASLLEAGSWLNLQANQPVPPLAEPGVRVLVEGRLQITSGVRSAVLGPGSLLDEHRLVAPSQEPYRSRAMEPSRLLNIPHDWIARLLIEDPNAAGRLLWEALGDLAHKFVELQPRREGEA